MPTPRRSLPCTVVRYGRDILMFDCGEGTQRQYLQSGLKLNRPLMLFVSHLHGDHILGIPGLLQTFSLLGRDTELEIYGPAGIRAFLRALIRTVKFHLDFRVSVSEVGQGRILDRSEYRIRAAWSNHTVPCLAYAFEEKERPGKFHPELAAQLGLRVGPDFKKLQIGKSIRIEGRLITPSQVMEPSHPGVKIVFSGDTYYSKRIVTLAREADILVHECTFDNSLQDKARDDKHSTPEIAARVAKEAKVRSLILNHVTQRYPDPTILAEQALAKFSETLVAEDFQRTIV